LFPSFGFLPKEGRPSLPSASFGKLHLWRGGASFGKLHLWRGTCVLPKEGKKPEGRGLVSDSASIEVTGCKPSFVNLGFGGPLESFLKQVRLARLSEGRERG